MQRRTATRLLRPFPLGLRFSGKNMSPLPCWLAGAHSVALNMSNNDLPVQLHFALFHGSGGYVLKPPEMLLGEEKSRERRERTCSRERTRSSSSPDTKRASEAGSSRRRSIVPAAIALTATKRIGGAYAEGGATEGSDGVDGGSLLYVRPAFEQQLGTL